MSRMAPAMKNRPRKPSDAPIEGIPISLRRSFFDFPSFKSVTRLHLLLRGIVTGYCIEFRRCGEEREREKSLISGVLPLLDWDCCLWT